MAVTSLSGLIMVLAAMPATGDDLISVLRLLPFFVAVGLSMSAILHEIGTATSRICLERRRNVGVESSKLADKSIGETVTEKGVVVA